MLAAMDALVKHLTVVHPVALVTFGRFAAGSLIAVAVWLAQGRTAITLAMWPAHIVRGMLITLSGLTFFYALQQLGLAETLTIAFVAPLLIPLLARAVLGERLRRQAVLGGLLGFAGVAVAVSGEAVAASGSNRTLAVAAALFSAVAYAGSAIVLRARAGKDNATSITLLGSLVPMVLLLPVGIEGAASVRVDALPWFLALGLVGNIGIQMLARAYARLESQVSAVMEFIGLPFAALFGWLFFAEIPAPVVWIGAAIIFLACRIATRPGVRPAGLPPLP